MPERLASSASTSASVREALAEAEEAERKLAATIKLATETEAKV